MDDSLLLHLSEHGLVTQGPRSAPWSRLSVYESSELVHRLLRERHQRVPSKSKSVEVATQVAQGRQFFEAAADAAPLAKPLLLYYGVLALSRAIILCAESGRREAQLSKSHGLTFSDENWRNKLTGGSTQLPKTEMGGY